MQADTIVSDLATALISEDSAYRSISRRSQAARNLLAIYVKLQGRLHGMDVAADVSHILSTSDTDLIGEDSAIRAIDAKDHAFFQLLGVWCKVEEPRHPGIAKAFDADSSSIRIRLAGDDSAIRSISGYTGASMSVLKNIVSELGHESEAAAIVSSTTTLNDLDDSAWRVAMRHSEANMKLILTLFPRDQAAAAARISRSVTLGTAADDSALRAQSEYTQGLVDALHVLIKGQ